MSDSGIWGQGYCRIWAWSQGNMQVSSALRVLCSTKLHGFLLGDRQTPGVCLRDPLSGLPWGKDSEDGSLKTQPRIWVRSHRHGRLDLLAQSQAPQGAELRV